MIQLNDIYDATRGGLDIILHYYPQARIAVEKPKEKFKIRESERTPSATLLRGKTKEGQEVWKVCDFGDDGHAVSPVDICMKEEGIKRFYEAVLHLAQLFGVAETLSASINKPEIRHRPARADEREGEKVFELLPEIREDHWRILGPNVKREHAEALHWYEAKYVGTVKNREVREKYTTDNYPIFLRECLVKPREGDREEVKFYKIYEPLNPDKGFRFSYTPAGVKPKNYINGLEELKKAAAQYRAQQEAAYEENDESGRTPPPPAKLERCVICSGERDALCCKSMGEFPIWFNSETYKLSDAEFYEIKKHVNSVYNIPDIDATGIKRGTALALEFNEIQTVWLPEWLSGYRDNRGKGRKDLRDWMELRPEQSDWYQLMELALPAKFWTENRNQKTGKKEIGIDVTCLLYFLRLQGYSTLRDPNSPSVVQYIHTDGNIVRKVTLREIRLFINRWAEEQSLPRDVRNLLITSPKISSPAALETLREVDLDFTSCTAWSQWFHFQGKSFEVTADEIKEYSGHDVTGHYVWEENILPHRVKLDKDPQFSINEIPDEYGGIPSYHVQVHDTRSPLFGYVINSSRLYWRREFEELGDMMTEEEMRLYKEGNKFNIRGPLLTDEQKDEQEQNLLSKLYTIGYMLHRYKDQSRAWAPMAMDSKIGESGQCNGRSGKSFLFKALSFFMNSVKLSGRNPRLMENPHVFDQVDRYTDFVLIDDCGQYFPMDLFYDTITSNLTVNPKNRQSFTIPFEESPKFAFTTNYVPADFDASTEARMLYLVFSDYYHQASDTNDYRETRSIRDDFGRNLYDSFYTEELWNADINFLMLCLQFYLHASQQGAKLQPPMDNIKARKLKEDMGENFEDWAATYFAEQESDHLDRLLIRSKVFEDYTQSIGNLGSKYSMKRFTKQLRAFVEYCPYINRLNPVELCNNSSRITRRVDGKLEDMIYLESKRAAQEGRSLVDQADPDALKKNGIETITPF